MSKKLVLPFITLLCLSFFTVVVEGQPYEIIAVSGSTPTVDGSINVGEWGDAASVSFNNTEVFVKQDGENLYIAFNVSDPTPNAAENVHIFFDVNHDGGTELKSDDIVISAFRNGTLIESYPNGTYGNATGWTASVYNTTQLCQAEFNITYLKINVTAGETKTLGVAFETIDFEFASPFQSWPHDLRPDALNPSKWGDMISTGYNWIPEFTSLLVLPLFTIALLLVVILCRRKNLIQH